MQILQGQVQILQGQVHQSIKLLTKRLISIQQMIILMIHFQSHSQHKQHQSQTYD